VSTKTLRAYFNAMHLKVNKINELWGISLIVLI
jgi:hypothetical protein